MSVEEAIRFSKDIGNDLSLAEALKAAKEQVPSDAPFPAPVEAAWMVGGDNDYSFTKEDYMAAIPTLKKMYDDAAPSAKSASARRVVSSGGVELDEGQLSRGLDWRDGKAGAAAGSLVLSYWEQNADNWGVASPDDWISHNNW